MMTIGHDLIVIVLAAICGLGFILAVEEGFDHPKVEDGLTLLGAGSLLVALVAIADLARNLWVITG